MSLSLRITSRSAFAAPALFSASNAMPALIAPSPMTATILRPSPLRCAATAIPSAAEIDVDECAVPNVSYSLSVRRGNPDGPPAIRNRLIASRRPVRILWAYVWFPRWGPRGNPGRPPPHPHPAHRLAAAGQDFVGVRLVPDAPHEPVARGI